MSGGPSDGKAHGSGVLAPVLALDGPAGVGKSTVAARLAEQLGVPWFSSGALYRGVTLLSLRAPGRSVVEIAATTHWRLAGGTLRANENDITDLLHSEDVDEAVPRVSAVAEVRQAVAGVLHRLVGVELTIVEGRDIGSEVFPDAAVKVFLDAAPEVRAKRRKRQRANEEAASTRDEIVAIERRDQQDRAKPMGALRPAADSAIVDTSRLTIEGVCDTLIAIVHRNAHQGAFSPVV